tara:strand:- start:27410 stop:27637 length:228 start_codon:yes stop_codon:yes gene_type:complete
LKNRVLLEIYYQPSDLAHQIRAFVEYYNIHSYYESLINVTPAEANFVRHTAIIEWRKNKKLTIRNRRLKHQLQVA